MQLLHDRNDVPRPVEEIGIAEGDVACPRIDLLLNVLDHNLALYQTELPAIHWYHRTVAAVMLAATTRFRVAADFGALPIGADEISVFAQMRQRVSIGQDEFLSGEGDDR